MRQYKSVYFTFMLLACAYLGSCHGHSSADSFATESVCGDVTLYNPVEGTQSIWHGLSFSDNNLERFNAQHHVFFVENCQSLNWSSDKRILLVREVVSDVLKDGYDYTEAPYVAIDRQAGDYADYVVFLNDQIRPLSLGNAKADFTNAHDLTLEGVVYQLASDFIRELPALILDKNVQMKKTALQDLLTYHPLSKQNITQYSNVALDLERNHEYQTAIFLMEAIIAQFPDYTPAYLTLGDAYWGDGQLSAAKTAYRRYLNLMGKEGEDLRTVPQYIQIRIR